MFQILLSVEHTLGETLQLYLSQIDVKGDSKKRKIEKCVLRFGLLQWINKFLKTKNCVHFNAAP